VLYVFLARSGKTLRSVTTPVTIDDQGVVHPIGEGKGRRGARSAHHVRRRRWNRKDAVLFSTDLSNSGVKASGFLKFCATLAPGNSLIKSASYLPALRQFHHGARFPARQ